MRPKKTLDPSTPVGHRGTIYQYATIGDYQKAVAVKPRDADLRADFARALEEIGDDDAALEQYRISTTLPPKEIGPAFLYRDYAAALEKRGDLDAAIAAGRTMLVSWPTKNEPNCAGYAEEMMGRLLEKKGDFTGAIAMWRDIRDRELGRTGRAEWAAKCDEQVARIRTKIR